MGTAGPTPSSYNALALQQARREIREGDHGMRARKLGAPLTGIIRLSVSLLQQP